MNHLVRILLLLLISTYSYAAREVIECKDGCDPLVQTQREQDQKIDSNFIEVYSHMQDALNPHFTTATQLNLGNVDDTSDADKPVSTDQQAAFDTKVNNTGNETIAGVKTFSSSPVGPDPTTDQQFATKKYHDDNVVNDQTIVTTDNTTNDVSTSKHGFAPKGSGVSTEYLDATGGYSVPAGGGGATAINDLGDATAGGAVDFVTYLQQWDVGSGSWQVGDGGSNYVQFSTTGITFGGTYTMSANLVSDYTTYTPAATEPATTDGLIRNVSGVSGYPDVLSQFDGTNVWRYISVQSTDTVGAGYMIGHDGTNFETVLIQSQLKVNTLGNFTTPITSNPYAFTAANLYNSTLWYGATGEVDLDPGVDGMSTIIYNTGAFTITIDPNGSEVIVRDGTAQTGGVSFTLSSGAGNFVALVFNGTQWVTMGFKGTLAEGT